MTKEDLLRFAIKKKGDRLAILQDMVSDLEREIKPLMEDLKMTQEHSERLAKRAARSTKNEETKIQR